jgi:hypothetical protein
MATFGTGSAQLLEVKVFKRSGSAGTFYTVPSGRYAEVNKLVDGFAITEARFTINGSSFSENLGSYSPIGDGRLLAEGDQLFDDGGFNYILVREYKVP